MVERLSALVLRRRRAVLVVAAVLVVVCGAAAATLFDKLTAGGFTDPGAESTRAAQLVETTFGQRAPNLTLLVTAPDGVDSPAARAAGAALSERLAGEEGVTGVTSYWTTGQPAELRSRDSRSALVLASIPGDDTAVDKRVADLMPAYTGMFDGLEVKVGGNATLQHELIVQGQKDAEKSQGIAFPVTLVLLVLIFGSVVAALLPLVVAVVTIMSCLGFMWLLAGVTTLSSLSVSVVALLGLGLAIDYSLLVVSRYREELRAGQPVPEALRRTMHSAGRTVIFSAVTVAVALAGLAWFPLDAVRSLAFAGIATALLSALASVTVLPALLVVLGPRIERWRVFPQRDSARVDTESGFWHRLATAVMRRPVPVATLTVVVLLLLGVPALGLELGMPDERIMPPSSAARQVAEAIERDFDDSAQSALLVVLEKVDRAELPGYATRLSSRPDVARVDTVTGTYVKGARAAPPTGANARFAAGDAAYLTVVPAPSGVAGPDRFVDGVRDADAPAPVLVTGVAAANQDATESLLRLLPYALGSVALAMLVLLFLITGSVLIPFLSLVLSALSLTATFGALVWIFQDGHLSWLFGDFVVTGVIAATVPAMLFALSFGLAMDYQVFLLSRIREEYDATGDGTAAVALGLEKIGRIVTAAAVLISIVFLAFTFSGITLSKAYGVGLPLAVLMDATLIRGLLLPATMKLFGRATWWAPAPLRRVYARFGLRESGGAPAARHRVTVGR